MNNTGVVSIDFWNTLVIGHTGGEERHRIRLEALRELANSYDQSINPEKVTEAKQHANDSFEREWLGSQRTPTSDELVGKVLDYLDIPADPNDRADLVRVFEESLWDGAPELTPGALEAIPELAERYPLAIISDTMYSPGRVLREYLNRKNLLDYFEAFVFSDEVGYAKPNPKAFHRVLDATGARAEHSYHIGDLEQTDVTGAKQAGMRAILYTGVTDNGQAETSADHVVEDWDTVLDLLG